MKIIKIILIIFGIIVLFVLSEALFLYKKPDELSVYTLRAAKIVLPTENADATFFVLTKGQLKLPQDQNYKNLVMNYLTTLPQGYDLPRVYYGLALISYSNGEENLTPELLKLSIDADLNFSFWYVELANYYLSIGQANAGRKVLDDCMKIDAPRKFCQDFLNGNFNSNMPQNIGFLKDSVDTFYASGQH
jgi:hypothetical protein